MQARNGVKDIDFEILQMKLNFTVIVKRKKEKKY